MHLKQEIYKCTCYYIDWLVNMKNPSNTFCKEAYFRIFPELTPLPNSIFQDIFQVKKNFRTFLELLKFSGRVDTLLKAPLTYTFSNSAAAEKLSNPAGIYLFKVNKKTTTTRCEICSELTIKTPE